MIKEDKELWKDLSTRLFHEVICKVKFKDSEGWKIQDMSLKGIFTDECYFTTDTGSVYSKEFKPYLRPLSSMTQSEKKYLNDLRKIKFDTYYGYHAACISYLNSIHVDYNDLIGKDLAIEVTKENNPYKIAEE